MTTDVVVIPRAVYDSLITQATNVANTSIKTGIVLSEEYENAMRNISENLLATIAQCPVPMGGYDGTFRETDVTEEIFKHDSQRERVGVKLTHAPTQLSAQSYAKHSVEDNRRVAMKALMGIVNRQNSEGGRPRP